MKLNKNKVIATLCVTALCAFAATPAFAAIAPSGSPTTDGDVTSQGYSGTLGAGETSDVPMNIKANIANPGDKIIKVTVPSVMPVAIGTKTDNGKTVFDTAISTTAQVQNSVDSNAAVKVSLASVNDASVDGHTLLSQVNMTLAGNSTVTLNTFSSSAPVDLFASIAPGSEGTLTARASAKAADAEIFPGSYTVATILKVSLV